MIVGVPREIKEDERRVAITPAGVHALVGHNHRVLVERGAGAGSGIADAAFAEAGAALTSRDDVWETAEMVLKVKEPLAPEIDRLRRGQILFTYLHLAASKELTLGLLERGIVGLGYVGLPLAAALGEAGFRCIGVDLDQGKCEALAAGQSYVSDVRAETIQRLVAEQF